MKTNEVVIIIGPGFDDAEVIVPWLYLPSEGIHVDVATVAKSPDVEVKGKHGYPMAPTVKVADLSVDKYDAVLIPGGYEAPDRVRQNKDVVNFVRAMYDKGKIVAAICHGPWVLVSAGILKGKRATCYPGMKDDLMNAGARYIQEKVVMDGNIVTADRPSASGYWVKAIIGVLRSKK